MTDSDFITRVNSCLAFTGHTFFLKSVTAHIHSVNKGRVWCWKCTFKFGINMDTLKSDRKIPVCRPFKKTWKM